MESDFVTLVSAEGFEFVIERRCANVSGTIRAMLTGSYSETKDNYITFPEISTTILEKVIEYFHYKVRYSHSSEMPEFKVEPDIALELLMASNFLDA
jgi:transcription elongation factor B subunit 1